MYMNSFFLAFLLVSLLPAALIILLSILKLFQVVIDPKKFPSQFQSTLMPPLPPLNKPQRQKIESPITDLSQDLKSESHDGWTYEEGEFIAITVSNMPYIDSETFVAPDVIYKLYI